MTGNQSFFRPEEEGIVGILDVVGSMWKGLAGIVVGLVALAFGIIAYRSKGDGLPPPTATAPAGAYGVTDLGRGWSTFGMEVEGRRRTFLRHEWEDRHGGEDTRGEVVLELED
jgi:hypothetical protein